MNPNNIRNVVIFLFAFMAFTSPAFAQCRNINIDYTYVTKAPNGGEQDRDPIYVLPNQRGVYLPSESVSSCRAQRINFRFLGAYYAMHQGAGIVRLEVYDTKNHQIGNKSVLVDKWIRALSDVFDETKLKSYSSNLELATPSNISRIKVFVIPGNWAIIIRNMNISFH